MIKFKIIVENLGNKKRFRYVRTKIKKQFLQPNVKYFQVRENIKRNQFVVNYESRIITSEYVDQIGKQKWYKKCLQFENSGMKYLSSKI